MAKAKYKRAETLDKALKNVREKRGLRVGSMAEMAPTVEGMTTGNVLIDYVTGVGGFPRGRITEAFGPPSSGKTTSTLQAAARAQARGETVMFLDYEFALDPTYCESLGLDLDAESFLYASPDTFEQGMNSMREIIGTGEVSLVIVDSVAAMVTEAELAGETQRSFSDKALLMAQVMRQLTGAAKTSNTAIVFLNHEQDVIDQSPMGQKLAARGVKRKTTPGGNALKFHSSLRLHFKQIGNIRSRELDVAANEQVDEIAQTKVQVSVPKNKVGRPFRQAEVRVRFGKGFSQAHAAMTVLENYGVLKKETGGVFRLNEQTAPEGWDLEKKNFIKGEDNFLSEVESRPEWEDRLAHWAAELMREASEAKAAPDDAEENGVDVQFDDETGEIL